VGNAYGITTEMECAIRPRDKLCPTRPPADGVEVAHVIGVVGAADGGGHASDNVLHFLLQITSKQTVYQPTQ
jgi:hypothetical protein